MRTPRIYLDKGVFKKFNPITLSSHGFQVCFSQAVLLDLKNDKTDSYKVELEGLTNSKALFLYENDGNVYGEERDALKEFYSIDRSVVNFIAPAYRFINGGGPEHSLFDAMEQQMRLISSLFNDIEGEEILRVTQKMIEDIPAEEKDSMKSIKSSNLRSEIQAATQKWSKKAKGCEPFDLEAHPEAKSALKHLLPDYPSNFSEILHSAMLLGSRQIGPDRGITSPQHEKSLSAAQNGYIDCLHIAYGLHCDLFITSDCGTFIRFNVLKDLWNLKKHAALCEKAPRGAPPSH